MPLQVPFRAVAIATLHTFVLLLCMHLHKMLTNIKQFTGFSIMVKSNNLMRMQVTWVIILPTCLTSANWEKGLLGPLGQPSIGQQ